MTAADAASRSYRSSLDIKKSAYRATLLSFSPARSSSTAPFGYLLSSSVSFFRVSHPLQRYSPTRNRYQRRGRERPMAARGYAARGAVGTVGEVPLSPLSLSFPLTKTMVSTRNFVSSTPPTAGRNCPCTATERVGTRGYRGDILAFPDGF